MRAVGWVLIGAGGALLLLAMALEGWWEQSWTRILG